VRDRNPTTHLLRLTAVAGLLAALAGCGSDTQVSYNCCFSNVWYVCPSAASYGNCITSYAPDPSGCTKQAGACPSNSNQ
jgi:hypothetical protein